MAVHFLSIFINVVVPVFALVMLSYFLGPKLKIDYKSLTKTAYYIIIPGFVFNVLSRLEIDVSSAWRMVLVISIVFSLAGAIGWLVARLMGLGREMCVAFFMTCVFGNVGNFGLAITKFQLGDAGMESATIYMMAVNTISFALCVLAAGWAKNGGYAALKTLFRTPGISIMPFALIFPITGTIPPLPLQHISELLGQAMIPIMLLILGLQLRESGRLNFGVATFAASGIRLLVGPLAAFFIIPLAGLTEVQTSAGIIEASMPAAVLTAIVALENDIVPSFVTSVVFVSTLLSLLTLSIVMGLL